MKELIYKVILIIISTTALIAAITYPIHCILRFKYMLKWSHTEDKVNKYMLRVYMLFAFSGTCTMIYCGMSKLLWWIPNRIGNESLSGREQILAVLTLILSAILIDHFEGLSKTLFESHNDARQLDGLREFTSAELKARDETIKQLESTIRELKRY